MTSKISPPFGLDRIKGGMSTAEAVATLPGLLQEDGATPYSTSSLVLPHLSKGTQAALHREANRIAEVAIEIEHCKDAEATLAAAWGQPQMGKFPLTLDSRPFWIGADTGWVASLEQTVTGDATRCSITFTSAAYFGQPAALPGVLGNVQFGMTQPELDKLTGGLRMEQAPFALRGVYGTSVQLRAGTDGRLREIEMMVPAPALEAIKIAWGRADHIDAKEDSSQAVWFDGAHRRRARIHDAPFKNDLAHHELEFDSFVPAEAWFGDGQKIVALPERLIGSTLDEITKRTDLGLAATPQPGDRWVSLALPATKWSPDAYTAVDLKASDGRVQSLSWSIPYAATSERDALIALFERKWGAPTAASQGSWNFGAADGTRITVHDQLSTLAISVGMSAAETGTDPR